MEAEEMESQVAKLREEVRQLRSELDRAHEMFYDLKPRLGVLEKTQLGGATVQAIAVVLLEKLRARLSPGDLNDIRFARERMADGSSLRSRLDKVLKDTPEELAMKHQDAGRKR